MIDIILGRVIFEFFGHYTLWLFFKLTNSKKGIEWLKEENENEKTEMDKLNKGCVVSIVGFFSAAAVFYLIGYLCFKLF